MNPLTVRRWHNYVGLFIAPSVLFFALTGSLQVFSLHEAHGHYRPFELVEKLSSVHKDQVFAFGNHHEAAEADEHSAKGPEEDNEKTPLDTLVLKGLFCLVGLGLAFSAALGLWIGLTQIRNVTLAWSLLAAGTLLPVALLLV